MSWPLRHKYKAIREVVDGISFPSKKEAAHYKDLLLAKKSGSLLFFVRQAILDLPGETTYRIDFIEFWKDGDIRFTEVKGFKTPEYKIKKRQVEELYPLTILEV